MDPKQLMKEAEDSLAGGWFSSPDHLAAANLFEKAGRQYVLKNKDGVAAMGAYLKAAKSHLSKGGRGYEAAAVAYEEAGKANPAMAPQLFKSAIELLVANGNVDRAIEVCARSADVLDKSDLSAGAEGNPALDFSIQVGELAQRTSSINTRLVDALLNAFKRLVKFRRIPEAIAVGDQLVDFYQQLKLDLSARKMYLSLMVLQIVRGDVVKAKLLLQGALERDQQFARSAEGDAAQDFMQAYEQMNAELVKKFVSKPPFTSLEYAVTMLAQELNPGERVAKPKAQTQPQSKKAEEEEEDGNDFPDLS
ncbi:hypothetical protein BASA82_000592 [Batrachochytrium salamandrivorans]|nr:hypothetical protein BASA82_000592 [Batrachochytrium salamandrivorans]